MSMQAIYGIIDANTRGMSQIDALIRGKSILESALSESFFNLGHVERQEVVDYAQTIAKGMAESQKQRESSHE